MNARERIAPRMPTVLAIVSSVVALACGDRKPATASTSSTSSASSASLSTAPAFSMNGASGSDSTVLRLAAATDSAPAGTSVHLPVAHAQSAMSDRGFWIGVWGQQVYVFQTARTPTPVQGGEAYSVLGTVRAAPHAIQGAPRGMTPVDLQALQAQHLYIAADSVARAER
jgi:hypothetical protein